MPPLFSLQEFVNFFLLHYKKEVSVSDQMEFVNGWYIMIIISDILTITGSILKMEIQAKVNFFPIYAIISIRFVLIFFQNVNICRVNDFFQTSYGGNLKSVAISFLHLERISPRQSSPKLIHKCLCQNHLGTSS